MIEVLQPFDAFVLAQGAQPWVRNPAMLGAVLGSAVGVFGGIYGTAVGVLAPRGKARTFIMGMHWGGILVGALLIIASAIALATGQPYAIWYGLGLPGVLLTFLLLMLTPVVKQRYREAEQRRLEAETFRKG
jgi:hypothetical protein